MPQPSTNPHRLYASHTPTDWFVFGEDGRSIKRGFPSREAAYEWIRLSGNRSMVPKTQST